MNRMIRFVPILLLAGCCQQLFNSADYVTRVYNVQEIVEKLKIGELEIRNRLDVRLSSEGLQGDIEDIRPQKGLLVVVATPRAQARIDWLLSEMTQ